MTIQFSTKVLSEIDFKSPKAATAILSDTAMSSSR